MKHWMLALLTLLTCASLPGIASEIATTTGAAKVLIVSGDSATLVVINN